MEKLKVKNRSKSNVIYKIPELGDKRDIRRQFAPYEVKEIAREEIEALACQAGGQELINQYLQILDEEYVNKNMDVEPEYFMSQEDVKELMLYGDINSFEDCLQYAPAGVIEMIKDLAISLPCNDVAKREAILKATNFDVTAALNMLKAEKEAEKQEGTEEKEAPKRKAATPKYNIVK